MVVALNNTRRLANPTVVINNQSVMVVPNSVKFIEGLGEQKVEPQSAGGTSIQAVYAEDVSTRVSSFSFELANTEAHIALCRQWKLNGNNNVILATGDTFTRTFTNMAFTSNYDVPLGADTNISVEFMGNPAV